MDEAKKEAIKAQIKTAVKDYARLACEDVMQLVSEILGEAGAQAYSVETNYEDSVFGKLKETYAAPEFAELIQAVQTMLDDVDARHTNILKERDEKLRKVLDAYFGTGEFTEAPTSGAV